VNNQYRILVEGNASNCENLEDVFEGRLRRIGKLVAVLDTWDQPRYLTRTWTIFEQFTALKLEIPVTMALPPWASQSLIDELEKGRVGIQDVQSSLASVDSAKSKAYSPKDEEKVKTLIQATVGFETLNEVVKKSMTAWIGSVVQEHFNDIITRREHAAQQEQEETDKLSLAQALRLHEAQIDAFAACIQVPVDDVIPL